MKIALQFYKRIGLTMALFPLPEIIFHLLAL